MPKEYAVVEDLIHQAMEAGFNEPASLPHAHEYTKTRDFFIRFLQSSRENYPWCFIYLGGMNGSEKFLSRLRVFLSRQRSYYLKQGVVPNRFKILSRIKKINDKSVGIVLVRTKIERPKERDILNQYFIPESPEDE